MHALPAQLRAAARSNQTLVYAALLREAAASVQALAKDRQWVGGTPGILAVLHTWTRTLEYHPHAHLLVTAGGLASDGAAWIKPAHPRFLAPGYMLSESFRAKMRAALARAGLDSNIEPGTWTRRWTVHVQQIGTGDHAIRYLSRYVYRVALGNHALESFTDDRVTFRYTHARSRETKRLTLPVDAFIGRFLQHVLPSGFTKIRSYGLLNPSSRPDLERARQLLHLHARPAPTAVTITTTAATGTPDHTTTSTDPDTADTADTGDPLCPVCQHGHLRLVGRFRRSRAPP